MARETPTDEQLLAWFDTLSNWGRWGKDDLLGTLNLITPEKRRQAGALIKEGISVSCGLPIRFGEHNLDDDWPEPRRFMHLVPGEEELSPDFVGRSATADVVVLNCHGLTLTHLDCPGHSFFRPAAGRPLATFNGVPASVASARDGVTQGAITLAGDGIVSRGVLLDIARLRGVDWLEPRTKIFPEDLEEAEAAQGVKLSPGDILCVRSGHPKRKRQLGWNTDPGQQAGPDGACLPWLRERDVALLACDTANDVFPPDPGHMTRPVHCIGIPAIGLWLLDGADYEDLGEHCARLNRWEFLFVIPPLKLNGSTASPVNPIAIL
jgi:kynurenine formamidase